MLNVLSAFLTLVFFSCKVISADENLFSLGDVLRANTNLAYVGYKGESWAFNGQDIMIKGQAAQIRNFNFSLNESVLGEFKGLFSPELQPIFEIGNTFDSIVSLSSLQKYKKNFRWADGLLPRKTTSASGDVFIFETVFFIHNFYPEAPGALFLSDNLKNNPLFFYSLTVKFPPLLSKEDSALSQKLPVQLPLPCVSTLEAPTGYLTLGDVFEAIPSLEHFHASWKVKPYNQEEAFFTVKDKKYQLIQVAFEESDHAPLAPKTLGVYRQDKSKLDEKFKCISFYSLNFEILEHRDADIENETYYKILVQVL